MTHLRCKLSAFLLALASWAALPASAQPSTSPAAAWTGLLQSFNAFTAAGGHAPTYSSVFDNEIDRGILYDAISNYSLLYLDSNLMLRPAGNLAAENHLPDYKRAFPNYQIAAIHKALQKNDGLALAAALAQQLGEFHSLSDNYSRRFIYSDPYLPVLESDPKAFSKAWEKLQKGAAKNKLDAIITLADYYAEHKKGTISAADQQDFEKYFQMFLANPAIKNGTIPKTKPITQSMYVLAARFYALDDFQDGAARKTRLLTAEKYLDIADSIAVITNYTVDDKAGDSYPMDVYHDQGAYYNLVMQNSTFQRILVYYGLAGLGDAKESAHYSSAIIDAYYRRGNDPNQLALFQDPLLRRNYSATSD